MKTADFAITVKVQERIDNSSRLRLARFTGEVMEGATFLQVHGSLNRYALAHDAQRPLPQKVAMDGACYSDSLWPHDPRGNLW